MLHRFSSTLNFFSYLTDRLFLLLLPITAKIHPKISEQENHSNGIVLSWQFLFNRECSAHSFEHKADDGLTFSISKSMSSFCRTKTCVKWKLEPCHKYTVRSLISFLLIEKEERDKYRKMQNESWKERKKTLTFCALDIASKLSLKRTGTILSHNYFFALFNSEQSIPFKQYKQPLWIVFIF